MHIIPFTEANFPALLQKLEEGEAMIFPSDTSYGFSASPFSTAAIQKIQTLKKRPEQKPFLLLVGNIEIAERYGEFEKEIREFAVNRWANGPPTTVIVPKKKILAEFFPSFPTIGIRVPKNQQLCQFLCEWGKPLISTSANISGESPIFTAQEIQTTFGEKDITFCDFGDLSEKSQSEIWKTENTKLVRMR